MRRLLTTLLLLALTSVLAQAQQQPAAGGARLLDRFGEIQWSDLMARLDNFAVELQNEPDSRGLVVAYALPHKFPGWPLRRAGSALKYLVMTRGIEASRLSAVNGGLRDETEFELWVVPAGAATPVKPFDASLLMSGEKTAVPFDRFAVTERGDRYEEYGEYRLSPSSDSPSNYELFSEILRLDPGLRGYVVGYAARRGSLAAGRRIASRAKLTIAKSFSIDVSRVVALGGGRREYKMLELWLVPPGAALPEPTPPLRPAPRRKQRRRHPR
jgi:hypothetical protein